MKKNLLYFFLLLIVGYGVYHFVFKDKDTTFSDDETNFTIQDTSKVGRVFMVRTNGESVDLKRTAQGWITDNKYPSRQSTINALLRVLHKQVARYPATVQKHNSIVKSMSGSSVKVEVYDLKGDVITKFYVGPDDDKAFGTYLMNEGAKRIFFAQIPNFVGGLSAIYSTNFDDWRSRNVLDIPADKIASISIDYPPYPQHSFSLQQNEKITVTADNPASKNKPLNEKRAKAYLGFFTNVNCEGFLNNIPGIDSDIAAVPNFCNIKVTEKNGNTKSIALFRMLINKRSKNPALAIEGKFDRDRMYGVFNNNKDTAVIQYLSFEKVLRSAEEFFASDSVRTRARK